MKKPIQSRNEATAAIAHFANLLSVKRKEKNLTQEELSVRLGVSRPTVANMLDGSPSVAIGTYFEAARILGVPLFDPEESRFAATRAEVEKLNTLLPQRVRSKTEELDADF